MTELQKTFAEILREQTEYCNELVDNARNLMNRAEKCEDTEEREQLMTAADELTKLARISTDNFEAKYGDKLAALTQLVDESKKQKMQKLVIDALREAKDEDLYLTAEEQKHRRIAIIHCEDEEGCGFGVEFKHPNCTFFFCKEHKTGVNLDLHTVQAEGVRCEIHGQMERYDLLSDDNVCPICEKSTLAILSVGR